MMIKLFLITLLCGTLVFADSSIQDFEDIQKELVMNGFPGMVNHFMSHDSLVRRSAQAEGQGVVEIKGKGNIGGLGLEGEAKVEFQWQMGRKTEESAEEEE
ncbi:uncharacterized protein [Anoplolepis gracilipes]|uniref:uncharacterized protein n=1 Tax=Anoplolepis gracilipes TaxID=354296 RepID=UPI003B9F59BC